jgi:hypothetical protein
MNRLRIHTMVGESRVRWAQVQYLRLGTAMCELSSTPTALYRKDLIAVYHGWFTFFNNTMRENAHGETDPR